MEKTKETPVKTKEEKVKTKKEKKTRKKATAGDIIFRILVLIIIFLTCTITYVFYLNKIVDDVKIKNTTSPNSITASK